MCIHASSLSSSQLDDSERQRQDAAERLEACEAALDAAATELRLQARRISIAQQLALPLG